MVDPIIFKRGIDVGKKANPNLFFEDEDINIQSDTFQDKILIDNRLLNNILIHLYNSHNTNSLDYEICGHAKQGTTAPATDATGIKEWEILQAITTVAKEKSYSVWDTDKWAWLLIRMKRATPAQDVTAKIWVIAGK